MDGLIELFFGEREKLQANIKIIGMLKIVVTTQSEKLILMIRL